ncbi:alpha-(1,3)-fucosyltransferase B-like [Pectinophora gossypiella]|uniref:alpha-(1,3)-fucosyltransferase B-like n=1 Tax=Pectinophora gossypiella TaxID=13191 RepID=UPI00214ED3E3|nr:alpha-(1,3)-fucosyltransferase B-like [Pectinophora gossypiella]
MTKPNVNHTGARTKSYFPGVPAIAWYTYTVSYFPLEPILLSCFNDSRAYNCAVYSPNTAPDYPEAYLFYAMDIYKFPLPRDPKTIWALIHDETPKVRPMFFYEEALNLFNFSSTFSRNSDVPIPLLWMRSLYHIKSTKYFVKTSTKNKLLPQKIAPVVFLQSDCFTYTEREVYVKILMKYIDVDSYGSCLKNKELPMNYTTYGDKLYEDELLRFLARYKFVVTIENAVCNDYVTEKFWRAIELGVVPIYYGSPLIRDWLPNSKSAILLEDFPTPRLLSEHLHYLLDNDTAYEEHLEHKTLGRISNQRLIDEIKARPYQNSFSSFIRHFQCFICERLHDRDSTEVSVVTKRHYECSLPVSALTTSVNFNNVWLKIIKKLKERVDQLYVEIADSNRTSRASETIWLWDYLFT